MNYKKINSFDRMYGKLILMSISFGFILMISGCGSSQNDSANNSDKQEWEKAKKENTLEAYDAYLNKFPKGEFAAKAKTEEAKILVERAKTGNPVESYDEYVKRFPNGKNKKLFDPLVYNYIMKQDSVELISDYIERFPDGQFAGKFEETIFNNMISGKSSLTFSDFAKRFPNSTYLSKMDSVLYDSVLKTSNPALMEQYLAIFPSGLFKQKIDTVFENILYKEAIASNSSRNFKKYLSLFGNSSKVKTIKVLTEPSGVKVKIIDMQDTLWKVVKTPGQFTAIEGSKFKIIIDNPAYNKVSKIYTVSSKNVQTIKETLKEPFKEVVNEEFNNSSSRWIPSGKKVKAQISNGLLTATVIDKEIQKLEKLNINLNENFEIEIRFKILKVINKFYRSYIGIVWGDDPKVKFFFVNQNGNYNYGSQTPDANPENPFGYANWNNYSPDSDNWSMSHSFKPNDFNTIKIVKSNKQIKYYINGKYLRFENDMTKYKGSFAGYGLGNISVQIDYLKINKFYSK